MKLSKKVYLVLLLFHDDICTENMAFFLRELLKMSWFIGKYWKKFLINLHNFLFGNYMILVLEKKKRSFST